MFRDCRPYRIRLHSALFHISLFTFGRNMKSGDFTVSHSNAYELEKFSKIADPHFVQTTFSTRPALVKKELVNGWRVTQDYHGGPYDKTVFDLVQGTWDHEHCSVCYFTIRDGHTYWENGNRIILLCDACYEAYRMSCEQGNSPKSLPPSIQEAG